MDALSGLPASPLGALDDVRTRLTELSADLRRLQRETAWECDAAREYRAAVDDLIDQVERLRGEALRTEEELRAAWRAAAAAGAW